MTLAPFGKTKLPSPPSEKAAGAMRINDLTVLAPRMQESAHEVLRLMDGEAVIYETLRTEQRTHYLYGFGRQYDDGRRIVTNVNDPFKGWHFFGLAIDVIHVALQWKAPFSWWLKLGDVFKRSGLRWGGDWDNDGDTSDEKFYDGPHGQWKLCRPSPSAEAKRLWQTGGYEAVWRAVGAA